MTDYTNDITRYLNNEMSSAERHAFEKRVLEDPFLAEALEGAELLSSDEFVQDIESVHTKIKQAQFEQDGELEPLRVEKSTPHKKEKSPGLGKWVIRIAAGVILLLTSLYLLQQIKFLPEQSDQLALEQTQPAASGESSPDSIFDSQDLNLENQQPVNEKTERAAELSKPAPQILLEDAELEQVAKDDKQAEQQVPITPQETTKSEQTRVNEFDKTREPLAQSVIAETAEKKQAASRAAASSSISTTTIRGKVTDVQNGSPIPGVNVIIKGTAIGSVTDANGEYQINYSITNPTLVFSFIGFENKEAKVENGNELNVQLDTDATSLSEIVVVGYGAESIAPIAPTFELAYPLPDNRNFRQYLEKNMIYPADAKANKTEGRVTVDFYVEPDGSLTDFMVVRGIGSGCDEELIRLIQSGPKWVATKKDGIPIRDKVRVRFKFTLPN